MLVLKFVIPVACTYGEPLCDEVGAQFYLLIVFLMSGMLGNVAEIQNFPTSHQYPSMEKPATRGRRVHIHTLVDL